MWKPNHCILILVAIPLCACSTAAPGQGSINQKQCPPCNTDQFPWNQPAPSEIELAARSAVRIEEATPEGTKLCSGVRIADDLILTAAHCLQGNERKPQDRKFEIKLDRTYRLSLLEIGDITPESGNIDDWALLSVSDLDNRVTIAQIATPHELREITSNVSDDLDDHSIPVWTATHPISAFRVHPRPSPRANELFVSKGFIKTERAYRESIILGTNHSIIHDDLFSQHRPTVIVNVDSEWEKLATGATSMIYKTHKIFQNGRNLIYHSADYTPGSSGGGLFLESGHLIGIIPVGIPLFPRKFGYEGIGQAFRIDVICQKSKRLSTFPACRAFETEGFPAGRRQSASD